MSQHFLYEYTFKVDGNDVVAHVSRPMKNISELKAISCFSQEERCEFARELMKKYEAEKYHTIDPDDINCPFAVQLQEMFTDSFMVYWTKQFRATLLFYTGKLNIYIIKYKQNHI